MSSETEHGAAYRDTKPATAPAETTWSLVPWKVSAQNNERECRMQRTSSLRRPCRADMQLASGGRGLAHARLRRTQSRRQTDPQSCHQATVLMRFYATEGRMRYASRLRCCSREMRGGGWWFSVDRRWSAVGSRRRMSRPG